MNDNSAPKKKDTPSPISGSGLFSDPKQNTVLLALNEVDSDSLSSALELAGCVVVTAGNEKSVSSEFTKKHPDVVVLDYGAAAGDSIQVATQILAIRPATKIIMIVGKQGASKEVENLGVELFLRKSFSMQKSVDAIIAVATLSPPRNIIRK